MINYWKKGAWVSFFIFLLCFAYSFVRYNVVRDVPFSEVPLYVTNKAFALATTILIGLSFLLGPLMRFFPSVVENRLPLRKQFGLYGFGLAAVHAIISLLLFDRAYYPRLFAESGKLTVIGESTMLFGVLAFIIFAIVSVASFPDVAERMQKEQWRTVQRFGYIAYILVLLHAGLMGYRGWFRPDAWQYGFASISLVASAFIVLVLLLRVLVAILPQKKL